VTLPYQLGESGALSPRTRQTAPVQTPRILAMITDTEPRRCADGRMAAEEGRGGRAQATAAALSIPGPDFTAS
jgi:hypothetical protein